MKYVLYFKQYKICAVPYTIQSMCYTLNNTKYVLTLNNTKYVLYFKKYEVCAVP